MFAFLSCNFRPRPPHARIKKLLFFETDPARGCQLQGTGIKAWRWVQSEEDGSLVDFTTMRHAVHGTVRIFTAFCTPVLSRTLSTSLGLLQLVHTIDCEQK